MKGKITLTTKDLLAILGEHFSAPGRPCVAVGIELRVSEVTRDAEYLVILGDETGAPK